MMTIEAMKLALEALETLDSGDTYKTHNAATALRQAIDSATQIKQAQKPEGYQEPVAWQWLTTAHFRKKLPKDAEQGAWTPLYTSPPYVATPRQRPMECKPLTDEQILQTAHKRHARINNNIGNDLLLISFARAIEAAHGIKEKNT